eukprot:TRINITY_DN30866_c0_g1_i2.p1 TRINITY_DN30866_c0_g1~~TRINITY_DN30866_c0_g1_i2.p1  ORF type:complete len:315 (+),score=55.57 TRINITY_DN30866_c0_g1_i2:151-1095(+)
MTSRPADASCDQDFSLTSSSLRSVGALFTMTASGFASTDASFEIGELARDVVTRITQVADERHVWFNSAANTMLEMTTPYSQVYGIHPRYFQFGEGGTMKLTPVATMMSSTGLSRALRGRVRSSSPVCNRSETESLGGSKRLSDGGFEGIPVSMDAAELASDPHRALDVYTRMVGKKEQLEECKARLREGISQVQLLRREAESVRSSGRLVRARWEELKHAPEEMEHGSVASHGQTLVPGEFECVSELKDLRDKFKHTIEALWEAEAEVDRLDQSLQTDVAQMQKDFSRWHSKLRKLARDKELRRPLQEPLSES